MKENLLIISFFLVFFNVQAQKYYFDTITKYSYKTDNVNGETIRYVNSKDETYFMFIKKYTNSFTARLIDNKNKIFYDFDVIESKVNKEVFFTFKYLKSTKSNGFRTENKKHVYDFQTLNNENDSIKLVKFKAFTNSKKKKVLMDFDLKIKKFDRNLFPAFRMCSMHQFEFTENLNLLENGIVTYAKGYSLSKKLTEYQLLEVKKIDYVLEIPKIQVEN